MIALARHPHSSTSCVFICLLSSSDAAHKSLNTVTKHLNTRTERDTITPEQRDTVQHNAFSEFLVTAQQAQFNKHYTVAQNLPWISTYLN